MMQTFILQAEQALESIGHEVVTTEIVSAHLFRILTTDTVFTYKKSEDGISLLSITSKDYEGAEFTDNVKV